MKETVHLVEEEAIFKYEETSDFSIVQGEWILVDIELLLATNDRKIANWYFRRSFYISIKSKKAREEWNLKIQFKKSSFKVKFSITHIKVNFKTKIVLHSIVVCKGVWFVKFMSDGEATYRNAVNISKSGSHNQCFLSFSPLGHKKLQTVIFFSFVIKNSGLLDHNLLAYSPSGIK